MLYPQPRALASGKTYYVVVEADAIRAPGNMPFAISGASAWTFTTAMAAPPKASTMNVAVDGSAPFCSLQGALDAVPNGNTTPITIELAAGNYHGVGYVTGKHNLTLHGADRKRAVISGVSNNNLNPSTT